MEEKESVKATGKQTDRYFMGVPGVNVEVLKQLHKMICEVEDTICRLIVACETGVENY
jgi:hypothetical protein